jgi:hypothetical protein
MTKIGIDAVINARGISSPKRIGAGGRQLSMRILTRQRLALFLGFVFVVARTCQVAEAQSRPGIYLNLDCPAEDPVGGHLCFLVREEVRKSAAFSLALEPTEAFVRVRIHSVDKDTPPGGQASAVAVIMTLAKGDSYLHDQVLFVGRNAVETAAVRIVAGIDQYLEQLFKDAARARGQRRSK